MNEEQINILKIIWDKLNNIHIHERENFTNYRLLKDIKELIKKLIVDEVL